MRAEWGEVYPLLTRIDEGYTPTEKERKWLKGITELDASGSDKLPDSFELLTGLQWLYLSRTQVADLSPLKGLEQLQTLYLSDTQVANLSPLKWLKHLQTLHLSRTQVADLSPLEGLTQLQMLYLSNTQVSNLSPLAGLEQLQTLYLSYTQVTDLSPLARLEHLQALELSKTQVSNLKPLAGLKHLQMLDLFHTQVTDVSPLEELERLQKLDLSYTQVTDVSPLAGLKQLQDLNLSGLTLRKLPKDFLSLEIPYIMDIRLMSEGGIYLENTTLTTQPISLFAQDSKLIEAYYNEKQIPINEAKVIFLGDGGVGKTHTIKRIHKKGEPGEYKTDTTRGIEITEYSARRGRRSFHINFWDFGGQDIMHAMHRCFLTDRTCYAVVLSTRSGDLNYHARKWLKNITGFAGKPPVLLLVNRFDGVQESGLDVKLLSKEFGMELKAVYYSAKDSNREEFLAMRDALVALAEQLPSTEMEFPESWYNIRQELKKLARKKAHRFIDKDTYFALCKKNGLENEDIAGWLLDWFNDLGVCFSYHRYSANDTELDGYKLLEPKWLINAIYVLINNGKDSSHKGILSRKNIDILLDHPTDCVYPDMTYPKDVHNYILDVMRKFGLSIQVSEKEEFIPALCQEERPDGLHPAVFDKKLSCQLRYQYLPDNVIHQLMILNYDSLNRDRLWRKGLRIDNDLSGVTAVLDMGREDDILYIDIYVRGSAQPWEILERLRVQITAINRSMGLSAEEWITVPVGEYTKDILVDELLAYKTKRLQTYHVYLPERKDLVACRVDELLGQAFSEEIMAAAEKLVREKQVSYQQAIPEAQMQRDFTEILRLVLNFNENMYRDLLEHEQAQMDSLLDFIAEALQKSDDPNAQKVGEEIQKQEKGGKLQALTQWLTVGEKAVNIGKGVATIGTTLSTLLAPYAPEIVQKASTTIEFLRK